MNREEEIEQAAQRYIHTEHYTDWNIRTDAFKAGAKYADNHPQSPWHSVADGDLPKEPKGDCIIPPFLVAFRSGDVYPAYYEEDAMGNLVFYDVTESIINAEFWMEIPQLPKESEVKK